MAAAESAPRITANVTNLKNINSDAWRHAGIHYSCSCKRFFLLDRLYYCQGCQTTACKFCVTQEIDSYYCPNCLENMASSEAMHYKNSCKKCFVCPSCFSSLSYQALPSQSENKEYYLTCVFCQWDSLDIGLKADSPSNIVAKVMDRERDDVTQRDVTKIIEKMQKEVREKAKEKRQFTRARKGSLHTGRPIAETAKPPPISIDELEKSLQAKEKARHHVRRKEDEVPLEPTEQITNFSDVTTLQQRFQQLSTQPTKISELFPKRRLLMTRRSKHCSKCDKLLIKPDLSPAKIEFKRQHVAMFYVPKVSISLLPKLHLNADSAVHLKLLNPVHSVMFVSFAKHDFAEATAEVSPLTTETFVSPKDHDDEDESAEIKELKSKDDPKVVLERKSNWMVMKVPIRVIHADVIKFVLSMRVKYKGTAGDQDYAILLEFNLGNPTYVVAANSQS
eukprot:TRINITY_DN8700_c0_g1_i1.p1 TRINITY_DN8700_c0_g1~~TRINITY_DN8700_c0_g1_i1.p1  ORF type:complete len:449 (+),score=92.49 TRINITY_DN8700_c0_g1_i1:71-1417(+)